MEAIITLECSTFPVMTRSRVGIMIQLLFRGLAVFAGASILLFLIAAIFPLAGQMLGLAIAAFAGFCIFQPFAKIWMGSRLASMMLMGVALWITFAAKDVAMR